MPLTDLARMLDLVGHLHRDIRVSANGAKPCADPLNPSWPLLAITAAFHTTELYDNKNES
jgi:hypothetical protein